MKKNKKFISYKQYIISLVCVAVIASGGAYKLAEMTYEKERHQFEAAFPHAAELKKFNTSYEAIRQQYVGDYKKEELVDGAIKGMTSALSDPFTDYVDGKDLTDLNTTISGSFDGIGATMTLENEQPIIAEPPIKGSPAEKARLEAHDIILKIDGKETKGQILSEIIEKIRGKKGSELTLTMQRGADIFDVTLERDSIVIDSVTTEIDKDHKDIGIISISHFSETTAKELKAGVKGLRKQGAKGFVIDVRHNPGGLLDQVAIMSSMFLEDKKTIVKFENKEKDKETWVAGKELDNGFKVTEPTVVLVDGNSASASEIFAAALNESADVPIVGKKTFGKGTVQSVQPLSEDSDLKLTTNKWLTPKGTWIHKKGIKPTIEADYPSYAYLAPIDKGTVYSLGMVAPVIKNINGILSGLDYEVEPDTEEYTDSTLEAVKSFQQANDLEMTGEIDALTANALEAHLAKKISENDNAYKKSVSEVLLLMKK
ncbi:S41 family peptidase [Vagococcus intermedius]|uniref:S41 family peptidase n=1 Tax=Vagococcus intermedius TaxID=2991418 RepID=A0AAF0CWU0_9ENTE|nr:S41 family peptidase [Vagococcus intermedius]WEG74167.1 S41 family peptidase [Vagococcus intermedius]WEG76247.1 S41 family peptidase [Vagococcus intermedius]